MTDSEREVLQAVGSMKRALGIVAGLQADSTITAILIDRIRREEAMACRLEAWLTARFAVGRRTVDPQETTG